MILVTVSRTTNQVLPELIPGMMRLSSQNSVSPPSEHYFSKFGRREGTTGRAWPGLTFSSPSAMTYARKLLLHEGELRRFQFVRSEFIRIYVRSSYVSFVLLLILAYSPEKKQGSY